MALEYCTIADLTTAARGERNLVLLAMDDANASRDLADGDVQAQLARKISEQSDGVYNFLVGRVDGIDAPESGSKLERDLRRITVTFIMEALYLDRAVDPNPWTQRAKDAREELRNVRAHARNIGDGEVPQKTAWSSTGDASPTYSNAATGGSGDDSTILGSF